MNSSINTTYSVAVSQFKNKNGMFSLYLVQTDYVPRYYSRPIRKKENISFLNILRDIENIKKEYDITEVTYSYYDENENLAYIE